MSVDLCFVGKHGDDWVVEVLCFLENKGLVPYSIRSLRFNLRALLETDHASEGGESIRHQLNIEHKIKDGSWTPADSAVHAIIHPGR